jgi:hypothetical protein
MSFDSVQGKSGMTGEKLPCKPNSQYKLRRTLGQFGGCPQNLDHFDCTFHGNFRVSRETPLQRSSQGISDARRHVRPGECEQVVPNAFVFTVELNCKSLFTTLSVFGQRSVRETILLHGLFCSMR